MTFAERLIAHIQGLNAAWQGQDLDAIARYYHPAVVLLPPDAGPAIIGRGAVVASYGDFSAADIREFTVEKFETFEFDATGICHMRFVMDYELGGKRHRERGLEVYVVADVASRPQIIWRSQSITEIVDVNPIPPPSG